MNTSPSGMILVIGSGHFGERAVRKVHEKDETAHIIVVDTDETALKKLNYPGVETINQEGISYLDQVIREKKINWVIPAVPVHVVFQWVFVNIRKSGIQVKKNPVPPDLNLPNQMRGSENDLYSSYASFTCPEDCSEPETYCTVTGNPREKPLYALLEEVVHKDFLSFVIRSYQLDRGVGGFKPEDTLALLEKVLNCTQPALISTACKCHGVTSALIFE